MKKSNTPKDIPPKTGEAVTPLAAPSTDSTIINSLVSTSKTYYLIVGTLAVVVANAVYAYYIQLQNGLIVTGLREPITWGVYLANFIFFIGISHAGTLISAILRLSHAEWRRPVTRIAESITVMAISVGALFPLIDLGRPDRIAEIFVLGRIQSPVIWDFISITTYLTGSTIYLYLPLIPDIAELRDRLTDASPIKKWLYRTLSLGWTGTETQKKRLQRGISAMALIIVPVAVSVHTVVSWAFAMHFREGWHTAIFGPYFVGGAIFSGIAMLILAMVIFRRAYHLEEYLTKKHFTYLAYLMLTLNIVMIYFTINEYLTAFYTGKTDDLQWLGLLFSGPFSNLFYTMIVITLIVPVFLVAIPKTRTIKGITVAAILISIGMWMERYLIVVPTMAQPTLPYPTGVYTPTWVEISITAGAFAAFMLLYAIFSKLFPIISRWEISEGSEESHAHPTE